MKTTISLIHLSFRLTILLSIQIMVLGEELAPASDCTEPCTPSELVVEHFCGSDGKPYNSACELKRTACDSEASITRIESQQCFNSSVCPIVCLGIQDPVCGTDGLIYSNKCLMIQKNCGRDVRQQAMERCLSAIRKGRRLGPGNECPTTCAHQVYHPICGSDGTVYPNRCSLQQKNCDKRSEKDEAERIYEVPSGLCSRPSRCPRSCVPIPDPVCGSDGKVYLNECQMHQKNCGRQITSVPVTSCL